MGATSNMEPIPRQRLHSYRMALSLVLLMLTVYPYYLMDAPSGILCPGVAAYSSDDLYLRHNLIDKFDIIESDDIIMSRAIYTRSPRDEPDSHKQQLRAQQTNQLNQANSTDTNDSTYIGNEPEQNLEINSDDAIQELPVRQRQLDGPIRKLHFSSLGKRFNLILGKPAHLVTEDLTITTLDGDGRATRVPFNRRDLQVMDGYLDGEARSLAMASFSPSSNKLMTAQISTDQDTYIVEPTYLHRNEFQSALSGDETNAFNNDTTNSELYDKTMIVYNLRDHKQFQLDGNQSRPQSGSAFDPERLCGAVKLDGDSATTGGREYDRDVEQVADSIRADSSKQRPALARRRPKRDIDILYEQPRDKTRCTLHLVADYLFYKHVGNGDLQTTINYLLALINRVNLIYLPTTWDTGDDKLGTLENVGFTVQNITIHQEFTRPTSDALHYNMLSDKVWGARDYLDNFSQNSPPRRYCLAHLLTYRQFDLPVLGLAYVASTRFGTIGGICSPTQQRGDKLVKHNTGISTSRGIHGETLITRQADLVLAHELGHNLGAEHDSSECRPSPADGGAYLMHPFAVMGFEKNNRFLSKCSRMAIGRVLQRKASTCFVGVSDNVCGNGVVEGDEQCDGGSVGHGHKDPCCDSSCRFTPGSQCSDRNSWCCSKCHIVPAGRPCRPAEEFNCKQAAQCNGKDAECPEGRPVEDEKTCVGRGLCRDGECTPFCEARQLYSCLCNTPADACKLCCKQSINSTCVPYDTGAPYLPDGVMCYRGVCERGRCEQPIQDVIERMWDVIEDINLTTFAKFLRDNIILVVLVASIPVWCVITHYINEFDKRIKRDVIALWNSRRRKALPSRSPFLPRLFVGDEGNQRSAEDLQIRNETLEPLKLPSEPSPPLAGYQDRQPTNGHGYYSPPHVGAQQQPIGFHLPPGEEIVIEPSGAIAINSIELPHQGAPGADSIGSSNNEGPSQAETGNDLVTNGYSTQV